MENVASLSEGRQFMIQNKYIDIIVVAMCTKNPNEHRRRHFIRCLRNLLFDYETYEDKFLEMGVAQHVSKVLIDEQGLTDVPEKWQLWKAKQAKDSLTDFNYQNTESLIDCLVLLSNSDSLLQQMHSIDLDSILLMVKVPDEMIEVNARLEVLLTQLAGIRSEEEQKIPSLEEQNDLD